MRVTSFLQNIDCKLFLQGTLCLFIAEVESLKDDTLKTHSKHKLHTETKYPADLDAKRDADEATNRHMIVEEYKRKEAPRIDPELEVPSKFRNTITICVCG